MEENMEKEKIRLAYSELQGYLGQFPVGDHPDRRIDDDDYSKNVNFLIEELNSATGNDYSRFKIKVQTIRYAGRTEMGIEVKIAEYRTKVMGLINRLHAEFFNTEPQPFSGSPSTSINLNQTQEQYQSQKVFFDFREFIDEKIKKYEERSEERNFLEKIRSGLDKIKNTAQLIGLILTTGQTIGLSIEKIIEILQ